MKTVLVTGGAGFIGSHLVDYLLQKTDWNIICLDRLDTSGNLNRLAYVIPEDKKTRVKVVYHDLKAEINEFTEKLIGEDVDYVVHLAAASHVGRSIEDPMCFIMDNVVGTTNLLLWAIKQKKIEKFINFSTDESVGPAPKGYKHKEDEPHKPSNPYAASKAGQEDIGYAFYITYKLPVITTRTMNNYGQMQHPEKLIPKTIRSIINQTPMPLFSKLNSAGKMEAVGSRIWIHTWNTASAIKFLLDNGAIGDTYNIIGFDELTNLELGEKIAKLIGKPLIPDFVDVDKVRPGHDLRYALDGTKIKELGWEPELSFEEALQETVEWYLNPRNKEWV